MPYSDGEGVYASAAVHLVSWRTKGNVAVALLWRLDLLCKVARALGRKGRAAPGAETLGRRALGGVQRRRHIVLWPSDLGASSGAEKPRIRPPLRLGVGW